MLASFPILAAVSLTFALAGFVKGVIGMGLPTVAIGLLSLVMSPGEAAALLVMPSLITNIWQAWAGPYRATLLRRLWPMLIAICAGTWIANLTGLGLLTPEAAARAKIALGAALMSYAAIGLANVRIVVREKDEVWIGPLVGGVTGVILAATGVFVIPAVPYLQALRMKRDELVQALGLMFLVATLALAASLTGNGVLKVENAAVSLIAILPAVIGMVAGQWVLRRVPPQVFRLCFFIGMLALGAHLALWPR